MLALCVTGLAHAVHPGEADRIEEILHRKNFGTDGQTLVSEMRASVEGCAIRIELKKPSSCEVGASFFSKTDYIDLRALVVNRDSAELRDFSGTRLERLRGAVTYRYQSGYNRLLRIANEQESQILDEEYENYPTDVDSRLRVLSKCYSEEINAESYSMSAEIVRFCSGVVTRSPLRSGDFSFLLEPTEADEFVALIERLSQSCGTGIGS